MHTKSSESARNHKPKSPPNQGQTIAHLSRRSAVTLGAIRIGDAIGLSEKQIKALALLSKWEGETPAQFAKATVIGYLQASYDDMVALSSDDIRPKEKAWALKFLHRVAPLFPPARRAGIAALAPSRHSNSKKAIAGGIQ